MLYVFRVKTKADGEYKVHAGSVYLKVSIDADTLEQAEAAATTLLQDYLGPGVEFKIKLDKNENK
jgi:hypothetical protein